MDYPSGVGPNDSLVESGQFREGQMGQLSAGIGSDKIQDEAIFGCNSGLSHAFSGALQNICHPPVVINFSARICIWGGSGSSSSQVFHTDLRGWCCPTHAPSTTAAAPEL